MATSPPTNSDTRVTDQICDFIVVRISYNEKLILPIEAGNRFLEIYSQAKTLKEEYQKPPKILPCPPEITIEYVTRQRIADWVMNAALGIDDKDDD